MGPWSFPILAEARMAERLLDIERTRLALAAAPVPGPQRERERPRHESLLEARTLRPISPLP
jgi:hypothetical protein